MRTIKFRVWDKKRKTFLNTKNYSIGDGNRSGEQGEMLLDFGGELRVALYPCGNGDNSADSVFDPMGNQEDFVIQQFTGCQDKNGKLIFEGDIIRGEEMHYDEKNDVMKSFGEVVGHVWYNEMRPEWVVSFNHLYSECSTEFNSIWHPEVIGNIFENENLLTENYEQ
jgi:uncharacterized phage protein (TIGR01671 family)